MLDPILKWTGGKRWMGTLLRELWGLNHSRRFVEPFCGGLAASLAVQPKRALLNDWNPHLIELYKGLKEGREWDVFMAYQEKLYYQYREAFNELYQVRGKSDWEQAQLFFYLIQSGFNGLCRFNQEGGFNVPFGKFKSVNYERDTEAYRQQFRYWTFTHKQFDRIRVLPTDFSFIDPPYDDTFVGYTPDSFTWEDQVRVADWAASLEGPVICTNSTTQRILELYLTRGFMVHVIQVGRTNGAKASSRAKTYEMVAVKNMVVGECFHMDTKPIKLKMTW